MKISTAFVPTIELKNRVQSVTIKPHELLENLPEDDNMTITFADVDGESNVKFDISEVYKPLGNIGRVLKQAKRYDDLAKLLKTYWELKGAPYLQLDILKAVDGEGFEANKIFRSSINYYEHKISVSDILSHVDFENVSKQFETVFVSGYKDHVEMRFLNTDNKIKVVGSGLLDAEVLYPSVFVSLNGKTQVSAGVHQVICTNGLVRNMQVMKHNNIAEAFANKQLLSESIMLSKWFAEQANKKIEKVREISVILKDHFSQGRLNRFWKKWSEKCELGDLTWYHVISDLTASVRDTFSGSRYAAMNISEYLDTQHKDCPTCSHTV